MLILREGRMGERAIVVTRHLPGVPFEELAARFRAGEPPPERAMPREEFLRRSRGVSGILCTLADRVDRELMEAAGSDLRVVSNYAVGVNNVDVAEAGRRGIRVCNTPDVLTDATADLGFALLLAAARKLPEAERFVRAGRWTGWDPWGFLGVPVAGKTLGIVGMGKIGTAVARRSLGFSMRILYSGPRRLPPAAEAALGASYRELDALLAESDFVVLCVPLKAETRGLLSRERIRRLRPDAVLVNISRGEVVDEEALAQALTEGRIRGAGLDVFEKEPQVHPRLLGAASVVLVPHIGSATGEARDAMGRLATENLVAVLEGREPPCRVN
jgi:glyoxylate reductase